MTEHVDPGASVKLTDVIDRAARITAAMSSTDGQWTEESRVLRNLIMHACGSGKTEAIVAAMSFDSLRRIFEADIAALAAEQGRDLATAQTAELLALAVLTEMSSLGTPGARRLRQTTSYADIARIMGWLGRHDELHVRFVAGAEATDAAELVTVGGGPESHEEDYGHPDRRRVRRTPDLPCKDRAVAEVFERFESRLEVTPAETKSASRLQQVLCSQLGRRIDIDAFFPTGSYARDTTISPLSDVDMMVVLRDRSHLDRHPNDVLNAVRAVLVPHHGAERVTCGRRSVRIDFNVADVGRGGEVTGFDVIPAVERGDGCYSIPDRALAGWVSTSPQAYAQWAATANEVSSKRWKPLVRVLKKWNDHQGKPVKPAFLIEVMAYDILGGEWTDDRPSAVLRFFAEAAIRVGERWPDPAGTEPDVSDVLQTNPAALATARIALRQGETACAKAMKLQRAGRVGDAIRVWQTLFGPTFAGS